MLEHIPQMRAGQFAVDDPGDGTEDDQRDGRNQPAEQLFAKRVQTESSMGG
jgi:hypothetical protein